MESKLELEEIYISTVIEVDGPYPHSYSMRSLASYAIDANGKKVGEFEANITPAPNTIIHQDFKKFWKEKSKTWQRINHNQQSPNDAINNYKAWLKGLEAKTTLVAYSSQNVWSFLNYYFNVFSRGGNPFGYSAIDMKSLAMAKLNSEFRKCSRNNFPEEWFQGQESVKSTLDKAKNQAAMFIQIKNSDLTVTSLNS